MSNQITDYQILKTLDEQPDLPQRALAKKLGVSLGKANYCLAALAEKGLLKINNFRTSANKIAYVYLLTPKGVEQKSRLAVEFLNIKVKEYERLREEIQELRSEAEQTGLKVQTHE